MIPSVSYLGYLTNNMKFRLDYASLPSVWEFFYQCLLCAFIEGYLFYFSHRLLHWKPLYWIHKTHHEYRITVSWAAAYANPRIFIRKHTPITCRTFNARK